MSTASSASGDADAETVVALVRHALPSVDGSKDPGLADLGLAQAQARAVATVLGASPLGAVYSSHLRRARETAAVIAERRQHSVEVDPDLREWDSFTPQPFYRPPEALEGSPRRVAFLDGRFEEFVPPHDHAELQARMAAVLHRIAEKHPGQMVAAVSHGGAINAFLALVVGTPRTFFFDPVYAGVSRVRVRPDGRFVLASVNEATHVPSAPDLDLLPH